MPQRVHELRVTAAGLPELTWRLDLSPACPKCEADARIVQIADGVSIVCSRCPFVGAYPNVELGAVTASVFRAMKS